ncbi:hypothetical protein E2C01_052929 [Portunus trituberculatus]|uniref:Uncharacterized protein n=1 Tax=Portunus trituberculatus TaxID=210409 RepID=A0A5B7GPH6_PORTR|nr:hypothetical protein [Portunus trituberculatus]
MMPVIVWSYVAWQRQYRGFHPKVPSPPALGKNNGYELTFDESASGVCQATANGSWSRLMDAPPPAHSSRATHVLQLSHRARERTS